MFITDGMIRLAVYLPATYFFLPLALTKSAWWFSPLFAIVAFDFFIFIRRRE